MSDNPEVSCTASCTAGDTSSQMVTTTTEEQTRRAAHDAVLSTYSEEAQKAYQCFTFEKKKCKYEYENFSYLEKNEI